MSQSEKDMIKLVDYINKGDKKKKGWVSKRVPRPTYADNLYLYMRLVRG